MTAPVISSVPAPSPPVDGTEPCRTGDPERFFPIAPRGLEVERPKAECLGCHIRQECLAYALTHAVSGIWGGTSDPDRRRLRRKYNIPVVPLAADMGMHS